MLALFQEKRSLLYDISLSWIELVAKRSEAKRSSREPQATLRSANRSVKRSEAKRVKRSFAQRSEAGLYFKK